MSFNDFEDRMNTIRRKHEERKEILKTNKDPETVGKKIIKKTIVSHGDTPHEAQPVK